MHINSRNATAPGYRGIESWIVGQSKVIAKPDQGTKRHGNPRPKERQKNSPANGAGKVH
jgi:hypothetical protein